MKILLLKVIFLGDFSFVKIFLENYRVAMTTTLNTSCSENTMVLSARRGVSARMHVFSSNMKFSSTYIIFRSKSPSTKTLQLLVLSGQMTKNSG